MKVKDLVAALSQMENQNATIELSRFFAVSREGEVYDCHLDFPIVGLAEKGDEVLLIVEQIPEIAGMGLKKVIHLNADQKEHNEA